MWSEKEIFLMKRRSNLKHWKRPRNAKYCSKKSSTRLLSSCPRLSSKWWTSSLSKFAQLVFMSGKMKTNRKRSLISSQRCSTARTLLLTSAWCWVWWRSLTSLKSFGSMKLLKLFETVLKALTLISSWNQTCCTEREWLLLKSINSRRR